MMLPKVWSGWIYCIFTVSHKVHMFLSCVFIQPQGISIDFNYHHQYNTHKDTVGLVYAGTCNTSSHYSVKRIH